MAERTRTKVAARAKTLQKLDIVRDGSFGYHLADTLAAARSPTGDVELSAMSVQSRFHSQHFSVREGEDAHHLTSGKIESSPQIVETGVFRMSTSTALDTIEILARHLIQQHDVPPEAIQAKLRAAKVID